MSPVGGEGDVGVASVRRPRADRPFPPVLLLLLSAGCVVLGLVGAGVANIASRAVPPVYEASAEAYLAADAFVTPSAANHPDQRVTTVAQLAASSLVLERVARASGDDVRVLLDVLEAQPVPGADAIRLSARASTPVEAARRVELMTVAASEVARQESSDGTSADAFSHVALAVPVEQVAPRVLLNTLVGGALGVVVGALVGALVLLRRRRKAPAPSAASAQ